MHSASRSAGTHSRYFRYQTHPNPAISSYFCSGFSPHPTGEGTLAAGSHTKPQRYLSPAGRSGRADPRAAAPCPAPAEPGAIPAGTRKILAPAHLAEPQFCSWLGFPLPLCTRPRQGPVLGAGAPQEWEQNRGFFSPHEHRPGKTPHS